MPFPYKFPFDFEPTHMHTQRRGAELKISLNKNNVARRAGKGAKLGRGKG